LLYIASYSRTKKHDAKLFDIPALRWSLEKTIDEVISFEPDLVGFTAMTINVLNENKIAEGLKARALAHRSRPEGLTSPRFRLKLLKDFHL
jgi:hypothetical protein